MKKYMIRCDMEGASGIVNKAQTSPSGQQYEKGRLLFMKDLLSLVNGLNEGGADEIWIYDEHYYGTNIDICELPSNVRVVCGKPPYTKDWAGGLDHTFSGLILLGFHAKEGTAGALLPHTYEPDIKDLRLNGLSVGEIGIEAAIGGDYEVPTSLVIGDSEGAAEVRDLIPRIETVVVKEAISNEGAVCYPTGKVSEDIMRAARGVALKQSNIQPFKIEGPVRLEVELKEGPFLAAVRSQYHDSMFDDNTLVISGESVINVWARYWHMKLVCMDIASE